MGGAEISEDFQKAREPQKIQFSPGGGVRFRRQDRRIKVMSRLIGKPVVVPFLGKIFLLDGADALGLEEMRQPGGTGFTQIDIRGGRETRAISGESLRINGFGADGNRKCGGVRFGAWAGIYHRHRPLAKTPGS